MTDRAATEPIGVLLLVGVVVVATVTLGGGLLTKTNAIADRTDTTQLSIKTEVNETAVTVRHVGGPEFNTADVQFLLIGDTGRVGPHALDASEVSGSGLGDGTFEVGDEATLNHSFTGYVDVFLLDAGSGDRLYRTLRSALPEEPETTGPTAVADSLDRVAEGYSITLDGSGSSDPDGSIESYSWAITSGGGSIVEDDTTTPNATYDAPADVTGDQNVTIELTVTDDDGNTDTTTTTVTVVDIDAAEPPGDGDAFDDPNGNGVYDPGEEVITKEDLEDGFDDPTVDLVIYPSVGEIKSTGDPVDITANTITAGSDFRSTGKAIQLTATGDIRIDGVTLESNGKDGINITSTDGRIFANETTMTVSSNSPNSDGITLNSNGDIYLESADLSAGSYTADLTTPEATLYVDQLSVDGTLEYYPNNNTNSDSITVNGTESQGTVDPGT